MTVGYELRSCTEFLSQGFSHSSRCATHLLTEFSGQTKLISVARCALEIADYATIGKEPENSRIGYADSALGDVKLVLNVAKLPDEMASLDRKCRKTYESFQNRDWVDVAIRSTGIVKKGLGIIGDGFFKPFRFTAKMMPKESFGKTVGDTWQALSLVKCGAKIMNCTGKLYQGKGHIKRRVIELGLEAWDFTYSILSLNRVHIHPIANIILSVCKCIFGLFEVWLKTA